MSISVRLLRRLRDEIAADLHRRHAFAAERVGFVLARWSRAGDHLLVLPYEYLPVADAHYIDDPSVGFRIDERAIRAALQATLDAQAACLHVQAGQLVLCCSRLERRREIRAVHAHDTTFTHRKIA